MPLKEKHWNWIKISIYIVAGIFVCGILKLILQIFNGTGPIPTGVGKVLGAGANLVNGIVNGCSKQPDCSKGSNTDKNSCENLTNCSFEKTTADGKTTGACISSNGVAPGGGINTMGCALGIGLLAWLAASILAPIAGFFISMFGKKNKTVEDVAATSGKPFDKVNRDLIDESIDAGVKASESYREEYNEKCPDHLQKMMSEITASTLTYNKLHKQITDGKGSAASEARALTQHNKEVASAKAKAKDTDADASKGDADAEAKAKERRDNAAKMAEHAAG